MDEDCHVEPVQKIATAEEQQATTMIMLGVQGMGCPNCAALRTAGRVVFSSDIGDSRSLSEQAREADGRRLSRRSA
jgi:hypothetical protein